MLSSLTKPSFPKAGLGIGETSVTALALQRRSAGRFRLKQAATIGIADGILTPNFVDTNIHNEAAFADILAKVTVDCGLGGQKNWSVSLPRNSARYTILSLTEVPASRRELEEVLDFKAETSFGVPSPELRISIEKIRPSSDGKARYFATAVRLEVIDEYESVFESLGWKAGMILPRAICELKWLVDSHVYGDALLISSQENGFTAMLLRGGEPALVRSVNCSNEEIDDEIYRLLVFYNDRYAASDGDGKLTRFLVVGTGDFDERLKGITAEALGSSVSLLGADDIGLEIPGGGLSFSDVAAPAGVATFGWK